GLEAKGDRLRDASEIAQRRVEELDSQTRSREANELIAGAGAVLGALFGGRRSVRSISGAIGSAASRRGQTQSTAGRRETAEAKARQSEDALPEIEQEILDAGERIDAEWREKAQAVEAFPGRAESADVRVAQLALVWGPTA